MKVLRFSFCSFVLALALTPLTSVAGPNRWTSSGPDGAVLSQIITDPADPAVAYARILGAGVFKTANGDEIWRAANDGLPVAFVSALLVLPDAPATLYAAAGRAIFISTDAAEHWTATGHLGANVICLAFDGSSNTLYAGTNAGVFMSADGGQSWNEPPNSSRFQYITSLVVSSNGTVYAVGNGYGHSPTLFRSNDHGQTWMVVATSPPVYDIVVDRESSTIYITTGGSSVFLSTDDAKTWNPISAIGGVRTVNSVVPAGTGHIYASTDKGVFE